MLFQAIQDIVYNAISDDETNQAYITPTQVAAYGNKALREIVERTEHYQSEFIDTTTSGTEVIDILGSPNRIQRVEVDYIALRPTTQSALRKYGYDWRARTGLPRYYYTDELRTDPDVVSIGVYPTPNATYSIRVTHVETPSSASLAVNMNLPEWCSESVAWSILADVYATDTEIMNLEVSGFYRAMFDEAVNRIRIRSFNRLPKSWSYQTGPAYDRYDSLYNNFPEEIPQP